METGIDIEHLLNDLSKQNKMSVQFAYSDVMDKVAKRKQELAPKGLLISSILVLGFILAANFLLGISKQTKSEKQLFTNAMAYDLGIESDHSIYGNL